MRILHISNHTAGKCGVALFGLQCSEALRAEGAEVLDWDAYYPALHLREEQGLPSYLPDGLSRFDVIHFNWQPATINHYHPDMLPAGPLYSMFLHDLPPWSSCPFEHRMQVKFALEPYEGATEIPPPGPDYVPQSPPAEQITIGRSNIRGAGRDELAALCEQHGWIFNDSHPTWLSEAEELERLATSWVNVVWYNENRSRGSAAMMCAAARRPLLLSAESTRFAHLQPFADEVYFRPIHTLEASLLEIVEDIQKGRAKVPQRMPEAHGWRAAARTMLQVWERRL